MTSEEAGVAVIDALNGLNVPYMVVGSFSSNFYGVPRATQDADFVVQCETRVFPELLKQVGPQFRLETQMSFEIVTGTLRHILQCVGSPFTIELFHLSDDDHDQERFRRRQAVTMLGRKTWVPTPEDVIITKLRWASQGKQSKHVEDVRNVIAVQGQRLKWDYVEAWCERHGTRAILDDIRRSIPPI